MSDLNSAQHRDSHACETVGGCPRYAALEARCAELERERDNSKTMLEAWQSVFGTTQLTHASDRLESAERKVSALQSRCAEMERVSKMVLEIDGPQHMDPGEFCLRWMDLVKLAKAAQPKPTDAPVCSNCYGVKKVREWPDARHDQQGKLIDCPICGSVCETCGGKGYVPIWPKTGSMPQAVDTCPNPNCTARRP